MTECNECGADVSIPDDAMAGELVTCIDCGTSYELVDDSGTFSLKPSQTVGEDWGQ